MRSQDPNDGLKSAGHEVFYAHSQNDFGIRHALASHLREVGDLACSKAAALDWAQEARLAGELHDLGKYGDLFQRRLEGQEAGLDHWSAGALVALQHYGSVAAALAIEGHHIGLQCAASALLAQRMKMVLRGTSPLGHHIRLSDIDIARLVQRARADGVTPEKSENVVVPTRPGAWARSIPPMLGVRMLFSCLVDADYLDTEAHFNGGPEGKRYREPALALDANRATLALQQYMAEVVRGRRQSSDDVSETRAELWQSVTQAAASPTGLYSLTAPTGSGKTLAMLQFALAHSRANQLGRIVLAVPYLSIIEQTARIYRSVFADEHEHFVLEHHSLAGVGVEATRSQEHDDVERQRRLHAENWDAPIIITTNVQLLESLFSNRPSACRKLHKLRDAVILFDEAQSLPQHLAIPTLAALSHLATDYHSSVVFATATQPAFDTQHEAVRNHAVSGWQPQEIVATHAEMFRRLKRVEATWPAQNEALSLEELASTFGTKDCSQVLCVLNSTLSD